jgi:hypothetical protein
VNARVRANTLQKNTRSKKMKLFISFLLFTMTCLAQTSPRQILLDSLNKTRESERGAFNLYIKKIKVEVIGGFYRNREPSSPGFKPFNFTYNIYLPFQFDLNYVNLKAKDKLLKVNTVFIVHHSKYGNYAMGLGNRFSFLVFKKAYLCYQVGLAWCEPIKKNTDDGINDLGFSLHHEFTFSYALTKHFDLSANIVHLSDGNLFKGVENTQDVLGLGVAYQF